ncbi:MAG: glycoside hydrolase family 127 protein [Phycisphaerales bacterium]|nr:MAG: glycoside hydrolase family 127 protein [Phycisphaerales bacterium]
MKRGMGLVMSAVVFGLSNGAAGSKLTPVPFTDVRIVDEFWAPRIKANAEKTIPHNFKMCEETGRIANLAKAAGQMEGDYQGYRFNDSDVFKLLEGACYVLAGEHDPALDRQVDALIATIAAAQQKDGYLNSYFTVAKPEQRWTDLRSAHELYSGGHLIEAAVAHHQVTGKRTLLDVACRLADHFDSVFGPDKRRDIPGHEEVELALVKLYRATGEERYLDLARFFIDERGNARGRKLYGEYCQDHVPVREQSEIVGHAVRAMYLYCGMADVEDLTGDAGYVAALQRIWQDVVQRKMYVTGGIGPSWHNEGFTVAYDLPNDTAYSESCASIGMVLWNHRLNLLHADARYVDVLERTLYNALPAGVSLEGDKFFYTNPLASQGGHHRKPWYSCACCPPNFARILPTVGGYAYACDGDGVFVNLYVAGQAKLTVKDTPVTITQQTRYPWEPTVRLTLRPVKPTTFDVRLRIPGWCDGGSVKVNGKGIDKLDVRNGYARVRREWKDGDTLDLTLPMPIRRIEAHPRVLADAGRVALQRGPIVYCLEAVDNKAPVRRLALPPDAKLRAEHRAGLLGGITVIKGTALAVERDDWGRKLYRPAAEAKSVEFTAVPYCVWDNREPGEMVVWLPESPMLVSPRPERGITVSASHVSRPEKLTALYDRIEPAYPGDTSVPHFDWWDHKGSEEWVQYDFDAPRRVDGVEIHWFDDERIGGRCRTPESWKLLFRDGEQWREVTGASGYGTRADQINRVTFDPVETRALRVEVKLREGVSGGILEWVVGEVSSE